MKTNELKNAILAVGSEGLDESIIKVYKGWLVIIQRGNGVYNNLACLNIDSDVIEYKYSLNQITDNYAILSCGDAEFLVTNSWVSNPYQEIIVLGEYLLLLTNISRYEGITGDVFSTKENKIIGSFELPKNFFFCEYDDEGNGLIEITDKPNYDIPGGVGIFSAMKREVIIDRMDKQCTSVKFFEDGVIIEFVEGVRNVTSYFTREGTPLPI